MNESSGYVPVDGLQIYYETYGEGGSPLVLLPGGMLTIDLNFAELIPRLAARHRVIAIEPQGHGRTNDNGRPIALTSWADDVVAVLDHLGVDRAHVLGHSMGGGTALQLAISHQERVRSIVPISITVRPEGTHPDFASPEAMATSTRMPTPAEFAAFTQEYQRLSPHPEHFGDFLATMSSAAPAGWTDEELASVQAPTLLVIGDHDFTIIEHGGVMTELIPGAQLAVLPGTTHLQATHRVEVLDPMLGAFLD